MNGALSAKGVSIKHASSEDVTIGFHFWPFDLCLTSLSALLSFCEYADITTSQANTISSTDFLAFFTHQRN